VPHDEERCKDFWNNMGKRLVYNEVVSSYIVHPYVCRLQVIVSYQAIVRGGTRPLLTSKYSKPPFIFPSVRRHKFSRQGCSKEGGLLQITRHRDTGLKGCFKERNCAQRLVRLEVQMNDRFSGYGQCAAVSGGTMIHFIYLGCSVTRLPSDMKE